MKSIFTSSTVIGAFIALLSKIIGFESSDAHSIYGSLIELWPIGVGIAADLSGVWARIRQTDFDKGVFRRPAFYAAVLSALVTLAGAFGYDLSALQDITAKTMDAWPAIASVIASAYSIYGAIAARREIKTPARVVAQFNHLRRR
jgi:hypothetical protein